MSLAAGRMARMPSSRPITALALSILACEVVGASGAVFTAAGLDGWYPSLARPALAPPNWVFGPVWTALFALMGVALFLVWREAARDDAGAARNARVAIAVFAGHFAINLAWSAVFFGARSLLGGLVVISLLWLAIVATMVAFDRVDRRAAVLLVPYLAWVSFASYLNYVFWTLN